MEKLARNKILELVRGCRIRIQHVQLVISRQYIGLFRDVFWFGSFLHVIVAFCSWVLVVVVVVVALAPGLIVCCDHPIDMKPTLDCCDGCGLTETSSQHHLAASCSH